MPRKKKAKAAARKPASTKSPKKKKATSPSLLQSVDPYADLPGHGRFPNYPMDYSCVRSTKDMSEVPNAKSAGNNPNTMAKLSALVEAFQKQESQGDGEAGEPSDEAAKTDMEK